MNNESLLNIFGKENNQKTKELIDDEGMTDEEAFGFTFFMAIMCYSFITKS